MNFSDIKLPLETLKELGVGIIYIFGSSADGFADEFSDIDIGIVFSDPKIAEGNTLGVYNVLYDIFSDVFAGKEIDIVLLERTSLEFKFNVIKNGVVLFESSVKFREDFEHNITMLYADFRPTLENFNRVLLSRI